MTIDHDKFHFILFLFRNIISYFIQTGNRFKYFIHQFNPLKATHIKNISQLSGVSERVLIRYKHLCEYKPVEMLWWLFKVFLPKIIIN